MFACFLLFPFCGPVFFNFTQICSPPSYLVAFALTPSKVHVQKWELYKSNGNLEENVRHLHNSWVEWSPTCSVQWKVYSRAWWFDAKCWSRLRAKLFLWSMGPIVSAELHLLGRMKRWKTSSQQTADSSQWLLGKTVLTLVSQRVETLPGLRSHYDVNILILTGVKNLHYSSHGWKLQPCLELLAACFC